MSKTSEARRLDKLKRNSEGHESHNIAKRYKLPEAALSIIEKGGAIHGQQSRAIQIAVEFLWSTPGYGVSDDAMSSIFSTPLIGKTYKLPPRTVLLIEDLAREYGTQGNVLAAVAYMLTPDPKDSRPDLRARLTKMPVPAREGVIGYEPVPPLKKGETMAQRVEHETAELIKKRAARRRRR